MTDPAVLLLAYGTPDTPDELADFLLDVRRGRPFTEEQLEELRGRYAAIGGRSPLTGITRQQGELLVAELARRGYPRQVHIGMRHWRPRIHTALEAIRADGHAAVTALILAPHRSELTLASYRQAVQEAAAGLQVSFVEGWSDQPRLIQTQADALREAFEAVPPTCSAKVIFSAHSLPRRAIPPHDTYANALQHNAQAIANAVGVIDWTFAFQSASGAGGEWLGPDINELVPDLAAEGYGAIVVMPIGFVCDHLEVLYDIDIETREVAERHGLQLVRAPMMNGRPGFIAAIADALIAHWEA